MNKKLVILVTRPQPGANEFACTLEENGFEAIVWPVLEHISIPFDVPDLSSYQALIFTSQQGVRSFCDACDVRDIEVFSIGKKTKEIALEYGFKNVQSAGGALKDLSGCLSKQKTDKPYLYIRGTHISEKIRTGHKIEELIVYDTCMVRDVKPHIFIQEFDVVVFFSKRTVESFFKLLNEHNIQLLGDNIKYLSISPKVLECVQAYVTESQYRNTFSVKKPTAESMLEWLQNYSKDEVKVMSDKETSNIVIKNAEDVIQCFGGIRPMSSKIDVPVTTIQGWKKRKTIPENRYDHILEAARVHNVDLSALIEEKVVADEADEGVGMSENDKDDEGVKVESFPKAFTEDVIEVSSQTPPSAPSLSLSQREVLEKMSELEKKMANTSQKAIANAIWASGLVAAVALTGYYFLIGPGAHKLFPEKASPVVQVEDLAAIQGEVDQLKEEQGFLKGLVPENLKQRLDDVQAKVDQANVAVNTAINAARKIEDKVEDVVANGAESLGKGADVLGNNIKHLSVSPIIGDLLSRYQVMEATPTGKENLNTAMTEVLSLVSGMGLDQATSAEIKEQQINNALSFAKQQSPILSDTFSGVPKDDLKAAALLLGMTQIRSALNRDGAAFSDDLLVLKGLMGEDNAELNAALERLAPHAQSGVLTVSGLSSEFRSFAGEAVVASLKGEDVSVKERAAAKLNELFQVEKNGELVTGTETQATLKRAQVLIDSGDVEGAIAQIELLDGPAAEALAPWVKEARATNQAQKANELLSKAISDTAASVSVSVGDAVKGAQ